MALFELKTKIYFGRGERKRLLQYLHEHNFTRCGAVIDKGLLAHDLFKDLISEIEKGLKYFKMLIYDLNTEPTYNYLDSVKDFFKRDEINCLIGIGGGSTIDVTKGLAVLTTNPVDMSIELKGFPEGLNLPIPVVAIPTISGTGSEVTYNAVFIDENEKRKLGINTKLNFPTFSLLDPEMTLTAPMKQTLSSALDSLVHTLESFMSRKATFITSPLSIEAFYYVFHGMNSLLENPESIKAREYLMIASYMAGIALMNSSAGPAGALSYPLGVLFNVPHGTAGAFFLPHILNYNLSRDYDEFHLLYERIYPEDKNLSAGEKSVRIVKDITQIVEKSGLPENLSTLGVRKADISDFVHQAEQYMWKAFEMNPVKITREDVKKLLESIG